MTTYAALAERDDAKAQLFVVERLARGGRISDEDAADYIRDARRIAELEHPNIVRVREVAIRADEVLVASDFIDGEPLDSILHGDAASRGSLEVLLRVIVDVLTGLGALHNLRDVKRQPLKLVHGELTPANVVVGLDGSARLVQVCRVASLATRPGRTGSGYLAPEVLLADGSADARADVYSAGVLLWEALSGRRMLAEAAPHAIVAHILSGRVPRAMAPDDAPWAVDLVKVAHKALSADPTARFENAAAMASEIRRIAGARLATTGKVAAFAKQAFGAKVAARRQALVTFEGSVVTTSAPTPEPPRSIEHDVDEAAPMHTTTKPPPPMDDGFDISIEDSTVSDRGTQPAPEPIIPMAAPVPKPVPVEPMPAPVAAPAAPAPAPARVQLPVPAPARVAPPAPAPAIPPPAPAIPPPAPPAVHAKPAVDTLPLAIAPPLPAAPPAVAASSPASPPPIAPQLSVASSAIAPTPLAPLAPAPDDALFVPPRRRGWIVAVAIAIPAALLLSWGGCRMLSKSDASRVASPSASQPSPTASAASVTTIAPAPAPAASTVATSATTATAPSTASAPVATATASAAPSETAAPPRHGPPAFVPGYGPPKPPAKPQPTYDPQGI